MTFWQSMLFVPADNGRLIEKVAAKGAAAVILDLEDAVAPAAKQDARDGLAAHVGFLKSCGIDVCVRINAEAELAAKDIEAILDLDLSALVLPKVEETSQLEALKTLASQVSDRMGSSQKLPGVLALIESPAAIPALFDIAGHDSVIGLAFGTEDFSNGLSVEPVAAAIELPAKMIALAAASRQVMALAVPISIAEFTDIEAYRAAAKFGKSFGVTGAICVHPNQVKVANDVFKPDPVQIAHAQAIVDNWIAKVSLGGAVASVDGAMVDKPVVLRAVSTLTSAGLSVPTENELFPEDQ